MKKFKEIIKDFEIYNPLPLFFEHGYTPEILKIEIINSFNAFFKNKTNLAIYAIDGLATTWVSFLTSQKEKGFKNRIKEISSFNRLAFKSDESSAAAACFEWSGILTEATNKYWSIKNLAHNTKQLCLEDMAEASFQMLGQIIEGLIKPYIKFHYQLYSIACGKPIEKSIIDKLDLGTILQRVSAISDVLIINPINISLNQWRNIAYHHNYTIDSDRINCTYGNVDQKRIVNLTRKQLETLLKAVYNFYKTLKISETFLTYDNLQVIHKFGSLKIAKSTPLRDESHLIGLYTAISTQGFLVKDLTIEKEKTSLIVQDLLDEDPFGRGIHSSQFLHVIWKFSKTKIIEVVYKKKDGSSYLISSIENKTLVSFNEGKVKLNELVNHTDFNFIGDTSGKWKIPFPNKTKKKPVKKDPFNYHLLTAIPTKEKYYSQLAEEISVKQFIKDFSLAIFSNYLVFHKLGYSSEIKINVGKEGSMIRLENESKLLVQVSASIKEKFIQQLIILCVSDLINFFKNDQLVEVLITEAMQRNDFEINLSLIKDYISAMPSV